MEPLAALLAGRLVLVATESVAGLACRPAAAWGTTPPGVTLKSVPSRRAVASPGLFANRPPLFVWKSQLATMSDSVPVLWV